MSRDLRRFCEILLVTTAQAVVLSVFIVVGGCLCPIISNAWCNGIDYWQLMKRDPSSASAVEHMTALMIWEIVTTAPLFDGMDVSSYMKNIHLL